jgi:hypothetical protein
MFPAITLFPIHSSTLSALWIYFMDVVARADSLDQSHPGTALHCDFEQPPVCNSNTLAILETTAISESRSRMLFASHTLEIFCGLDQLEHPERSGDKRPT